MRLVGEFFWDLLTVREPDPSFPLVGDYWTPEGATADGRHRPRPEGVVTYRHSACWSPECDFWVSVEQGCEPRPESVLTIPSVDCGSPKRGFRCAKRGRCQRPGSTTLTRGWYAGIPSGERHPTLKRVIPTWACCGISREVPRWGPRVHMVSICIIPTPG